MTIREGRTEDLEALVGIRLRSDVDSGGRPFPLLQLRERLAVTGR